ncbi:MAG TPA: MlaD family protein [Thermodesulfovibrionales bacterium]|nr:MlaD family protein [Thermodesulfovibrionales bacterium]
MFEMKKQLMWSKLRVGLVATLAFVVLLFTVFLSGSLEDIFSPKVMLRAQIEDVRGLRKGAPVWISGIEVGSVKQIRLSGEYGTIVTLSVNKSTLKYIKKDSHASVLTMGLLGDKYVELSAGSSKAEPIQPGDMIRGASQIDLKNVMEIGTASIQKMTDFLTKMDHLVTRIEQGEGSISKFISDPSLYNNLKESTKTLSSTLKEIKDARGTVRLLLEDPTLYNKMVNASASLEQFSKSMNESSGTLKKLIEDPALYNRMLTAASSVEEFSSKVNEGQGTLKKLAEDAELYDNLNKASLRLSSILERIDKGEGVAGSLLKDEKLATDLKENIASLNELIKDIKEHPTKYFKFSVF